MKGHAKERARQIAAMTPSRERPKPVSDWAATIGRDFPDLVALSPSPDGPLSKAN